MISFSTIMREIQTTEEVKSKLEAKSSVTVAKDKCCFGTWLPAEFLGAEPLARG
jgi:hypothetical protein